MFKSSIRYALLFLALASLGCPTNPGGPVLEAPGIALLHDSNFNSLQLNGDFMPGANDGWDANDPRHEMTLTSDYHWEITASIDAGDLADVPPPAKVEFKFTHDNSWEAPQNFGDSGEPGLAIYDKDKGNIGVEISGGPGFYTFEFDDETLRYSSAPRQATGRITGVVELDGDPPTSPVEVTLFVNSFAGETELWSVEPARGPFVFSALADSLFTLRIAAGGYASAVLADVRVEGGVAPAQSVTLNQVFGAISGTVFFSDDPVTPPVVTVTATDTLLNLVAGTATTDALGAYIVEGLSAGTFDLRFTAEGYSAGELLAITISGDGEEPGNDITMDPSPFATPDPPYFTAVIDGTLDVGWAPDITDPAGDSNWGPNDYTGLHVAWDADHLYIAVTGTFEAGTNTVNIYVDSDYNDGTGVVNLSTISGGAVGDHLRKNINMSGVAGFGADLAGSVWGQTSDAQVTDISTPGAISELAGSALMGTTSIVEFSVPWLSVYPDFGGGVPPLATLGIYCIIGGGGDGFFAEDSLPAVGSVAAPDAVFTIQVDTDER